MLNKVKIIFTALLIISLLCIHAFAMDTVEARIPVTIEGGGIAVIVPTVNSPIPDKTEITVKDGETGCFIIHITEPGTFSYIISVEKESQGQNVIHRSIMTRLFPALLMMKGSFIP